MADIGALLIGHRTFTGDDPNKGTDSEGAFGGRWHGPSVVLTHAPAPDDLDTRRHVRLRPRHGCRAGQDGRRREVRQRARRRRRAASASRPGSSTRCWSSSRRCCSATAPGSSSTRAAPTWASSGSARRATRRSSGTASGGEDRYRARQLTLLLVEREEGHRPARTVPPVPRRGRRGRARACGRSPRRWPAARRGRTTGSWLGPPPRAGPAPTCSAERVERVRLVEAERPDRRAPQAGEVATHTELLAQVTRDAADVGARAAAHRDRTRP